MTPTWLALPGRTGRRPINPWIAFAIVAGGQLMVMLDVTVVFTALPSIQADLGLSDAERQWAVNAYTLLFGGCLLLGGRLSDLLGRRRMFVAGTALFTAASAADALATTPTQLIAARAVQGLGAAMLAPAALGVVTATFATGPGRARAMVAWAAVAACGGALGMLVGGALTDLLSWEWAFLINVPIGGAGLLAALLAIPPDAPAALRRRAFDAVGAVLVTLGLALLVLAIVQTETSGWLGSRTLLYAAGAAILLAAFVVAELRHPAPLVPLARLRSRPLVAANVGALAVLGGNAGAFFVVSIYLQQGRGWNALESGAAIMPLALSILAFAPLSEHVARRVGVRVPVVAGLLTTAVGAALLTGIGPDGSYPAEVLPGLVLLGAGTGTSYGPLTLIANDSLADEDAGLASGLYNTANQIGALLAVAAMSTIAESASGGVADPTAALATGTSAAFEGLAGALLLLAVLAVWAVRPRDVASLATGASRVPAL